MASQLQQEVEQPCLTPSKPSAWRLPWSGRRWWSAAANGLLLGALLALAIEIVQVELGGNCHALLNGRVYRCSQPSSDELERMIRRFGVRTVINVRGNGVPMPWYLEECRATTRLDVGLEDVCLSAARLPSSHEIQRLIDVLDHCEYPVLFHCHKGADRTGLACAVLFLTRTNADLATARHQLSLRYGHVALGKAAQVDRFLDSYATWLKDHGICHTPERFREWIDHDYREYEARLELLSGPRVIRSGDSGLFEVRAHNESINTWRFGADRTAGTHACYMVNDSCNRQVVQDRAGLFEAVVAPGESVDLKLPLPPLPAGSYRLFVDLCDEQHCMFNQIGSEPLEVEFEVRP